MPFVPRLLDVQIPAAPEGIAIVLHGGAGHRRPMRVSPAQLSVLRMAPVAGRISRATKRRVAVLRLLNSRRGWDTQHTPLRDVEWALDEAGRRFGRDLAVCLVGHSLGGRAALMSAGRPEVTGVVAMAPWVLASDVPHGVGGTRVVVIHGDADRIASPTQSRELAGRLRRQTSVSFVSVRGGTHAMLRRRAAFDGLAARCAEWILLGNADGAVTRRIAAGEPAITV